MWSWVTLVRQRGFRRFRSSRRHVEHPTTCPRRSSMVTDMAARQMYGETFDPLLIFCWWFIWLLHRFFFCPLSYLLQNISAFFFCIRFCTKKEGLLLCVKNTVSNPDYLVFRHPHANPKKSHIFSAIQIALQPPGCTFDRGVADVVKLFFYTSYFCK